MALHQVTGFHEWNIPVSLPNFSPMARLDDFSKLIERSTEQLWICLSEFSPTFQLVHHSSVQRSEERIWGEWLWNGKSVTYRPSLLSEHISFNDIHDTLYWEPTTRQTRWRTHPANKMPLHSIDWTCERNRWCFYSVGCYFKSDTQPLAHRIVIRSTFWHCIQIGERRVGDFSTLVGPKVRRRSSVRYAIDASRMPNVTWRYTRQFSMRSKCAPDSANMNGRKP